MEAVLTVGAEDRREGEGGDGMGIQQGLRPLMDPGGNSSSGAWEGLAGLVGHWPGRLCAGTVGGALPSGLDGRREPLLLGHGGSRMSHTCRFQSAL